MLLNGADFSQQTLEERLNRLAAYLGAQYESIPYSADMIEAKAFIYHCALSAIEAKNLLNEENR